MQFGYAPMNHASGLAPHVLGAELERRGYDSVWMPEHSHIPAARESEYVAGGELPEGYFHMMAPFVSLATMVATTSSLTLATGVVQVFEHDLIDLAKTVATLDVLSGGRVVLGVGAGWNREEFANHRPDIDFGDRYLATEERLDALRLIWSTACPGFEGRWDRFTPSWIRPEPTRSIPLALGMTGPKGLALAARKADHWVPADAFLKGDDGRSDVAGWVQRFRSMVESGGRDPSGVAISMFYSGVAKERRLDAAIEAGVDGIVFLPATMQLDDPDATERRLDELQPYLERYR